MITINHVPTKHRAKVQEIYDGGGVWEVVLKDGWIHKGYDSTMWIYNQELWLEEEESDEEVIADLVDWFSYVEAA